MDKYAQRQEKRSAINEVPPPPEKCSRRECEDDIGILIAEVNKNGRRYHGAFSQFGIIRRNGEGQVLSMKEGYQWSRWIARCHQCYQRELLTVKKRLQVPDHDKKALAYIE